MSTPNQDHQSHNDWLNLWQRIKAMTIEPVKHVPFVGYFIIGVFLFGPLGIWAEIIKYGIEKDKYDFSGLLIAIITFFPALAVPSAILMILKSSSDKNISMLATGLLCIHIICAGLLAFFSTTHPNVVFFFGAVFSLFSLYIWWIANGEDPTFRNQPPADVASGGSTNVDLSGDMTGIRS